MKQFIFCEDTEGGMLEQIVTSPRNLRLRGFLSAFNMTSDAVLIAWADKAEIGDYYNHWLGIMIRIKDK